MLFTLLRVEVLRTHISINNEAGSLNKRTVFCGFQNVVMESGKGKTAFESKVYIQTKKNWACRKNGLMSSTMFSGQICMDHKL